MSRSCIVVGAGPAGLSAAHRLATAGVHVTVLEGATAVGGRTRTERVGGFVVNTGAGFLTSFYEQTLALAHELQLGLPRPRERTAVVATRFGKFPFEPGARRGVWRFPLIPWSGKLRAMWLFARLLAGRRLHIADLDALARSDRGGSIEQWGRRHLGAAGYDYLLRGAIESFLYYGAEEASAAVGKALMQHAAKWEPLVLHAGMGALCEALAQHLGVRTGCWAGAVEARTGSVLVHHSGGTVEADGVILALPASAALRLEGAVAGPDREDLATVRYSPTIALFFGYERAVTVQYPSVNPSGPGRHPIASVWTMSRWIPAYVPEGKELIAMYAAGWRAAELLERNPDRLVAGLRADAEEVFGRLADPDWIRVYPHPEASVVPAPGHFRRMQALLRRPRERVLYAGDWLTGSTIEGAVRSGMRAAAEFLAAPH